MDDKAYGLLLLLNTSFCLFVCVGISAPKKSLMQMFFEAPITHHMRQYLLTSQVLNFDGYK